MNLYFKFQLTSKSLDAQPISVGVVSDDILKKRKANRDQFNEIMNVEDIFESKSFYAEFTDFDINRCNDWVKENVVKKLHLKYFGKNDSLIENFVFKEDACRIREMLFEWLKQFKDYQIQFVGDCCSYDWVFLMELIGEWEETVSCSGSLLEHKNCEHKDFCQTGKRRFCLGSPKLPDNISPVPIDINQMIAGIDMTQKEAFNMNREEMAAVCFENFKKASLEHIDKHNALWNAKTIKEIYNKLKCIK